MIRKIFAIIFCIFVSCGFAFGGEEHLSWESLGDVGSAAESAGIAGAFVGKGRKVKCTTND